jgi:putative chitinase
MADLDNLESAFRAVAPTLDDAAVAAWVSAYTPLFLESGMTTARRIAAFLGQTGEETGGYKVFEENLNYRGSRAWVLWGLQHFKSLADANAVCSAGPEAFACRVYGSRMGNVAGSTDGFVFRGRGPMQITGRALYTEWADTLQQTPEDAAVFAATVAGGAASAVWFWSRARCNCLADGWQISALTIRVNGGTFNLAERQHLSAAALAAF